MSLVFYDTETTGTEAPFDQILQFAAILTDADFNELDRFEMRCRLQPHIVPAPMAMAITKVRAAQLTDKALPSHYEMVCALRKKLLSWSPANFVGYNSIEFDEHLLRQALYQTLHHPYLTNSPGNARSDIIRIVRACAQFAPEALVIPVGDRGQNVFKLGLVAAANGFNSHNAHDAMGDVEATIYLARILAEKAAEIWSSAMRFSLKAAALDFITNERVFCFGEHYYGKSYAWTVTGLAVSQANSSDYFVFDLAVDPQSLAGLDEEQLVSRIGKSPKPVRVVKVNGGPIFTDFPEACGATSANKIGHDKLEERIAFIENNPEFRDRLVNAYLSTKEAKDESPHVEGQIYSAFTSAEDLKLCEKFHSAPWEKREALIVKLKDTRLQHLGRRLIAIERPDVLHPDARQAHHDWLTAKLLSEEDVPWLTLSAALQNIDEMIAAADEAGVAHLGEHRSLLQQWLSNLSG